MFDVNWFVCLNYLGFIFHMLKQHQYFSVSLWKACDVFHDKKNRRKVCFTCYSQRHSHSISLPPAFQFTIHQCMQRMHRDIRLLSTDSEIEILHTKHSQIANFLGPTWGPAGTCRPQMGPCWPYELCYQGYQSWSRFAIVCLMFHCGGSRSGQHEGQPPRPCFNIKTLFLGMRGRYPTLLLWSYGMLIRWQG